MSPRLEAEVVVVGGGPGGIAAAEALVQAGIDTLLVEEGGENRVEGFTGREEELLHLRHEGGGRTAAGGALRVEQGRGLGGGATVGHALYARMPERRIEDQARRQGLPELPGRLRQLYLELEARLRPTPIGPEEINRHNALFRQGCLALGLRHRVLEHARQGCVGTGACQLGCALGARRDAATVLLPAALRAGLRVATGLRVQRIHHRWGRVHGLRCVPAAGDGPPVELRARVVVLAASATVTPALVLASGLARPGHRVGEGLYLHPTATVTALFDAPVEAWRGIPRSVACTALHHPSDPARRALIAPAFEHPAAAAAALPGVGAALAGLLREYRYLASSEAILAELSPGRVGASRLGRPRLHHALGDDDARMLAHAVSTAAAIWLGAGARRVLIPWARPVLLSSLAEAQAIAERNPRPLDPPLRSSWPVGGMAMAGSARAGATDPTGRVYGLRGLYVADGSLLPGPTGVPPQLTILALGRMVGQTIAGAGH